MGEFPFLLTNLSASEKERGGKKVLKKTQLGSEVLRSTISGAGAQGWGAVQAELMGGTQPGGGLELGGLYGHLQPQPFDAAILCSTRKTKAQPTREHRADLLKEPTSPAQVRRSEKAKSTAAKR